MAARQTASKTEKSPVEIKLAHSPDSDDAFMFYALATHKLATPGYKYTHVLADIQTLNEAALTETYDVTAISFVAQARVGGKADGGDVVGLRQGGFVQRLDVRENVRVLVAGRGELVGGQGVEHEGIVGIRRMRQLDLHGRFFGLRGGLSGCHGLDIPLS